MPVFAPLLALAVAAAPAAVTVPFTWTPGQIEVHVTVDDRPETFVLDTGSEYSVVSTRLAQALHLKTGRGGIRDFADGVTIGVGPLTLERQRVMVMPFDTFYARGRHIEGLLGFDVFARFAVKIDWDARTLTLWEHAAFTPPASAVAVPITFSGRLPVVDARLQLGDRTLAARLMVDTGASQSVILRHPYASANGLLELGTAPRSAPSLADGVRRLVAIPAEALTVGALTFARPDVLAFSEPSGAAAATDTDGLIGNTLLSRFTLYVDFAGKQLYLAPRAR